jgi:hypothetical protein
MIISGILYCGDKAETSATTEPQVCRQAEAEMFRKFTHLMFS